MTRQEILQNIYLKLRTTGAVRTIQDFAQQIEYNYSATSSALNGAERYLTDRFFTRILRAFPQVNEDYIKTGEGDVLLPDPEKGEQPQQTGTGIMPLVSRNSQTIIDIDKVMAVIGEQQELTRRQQAQTDKALDQIDKLIQIIQTMSGGMQR